MLRTILSVHYSLVVLRHLGAFSFSLVLLATAASGQTETNGSTPVGLSRGAPAGSYALSGFDNVNLFNGHMNFRLPLLAVVGRGNAGYQMALPVEQTWTIFKQKNEITGVITYHPEPNWWTGIKPGYGAGVLQGRKGGTGSLYCGQNSPWYRYSKTLTRLTFTAGDGTEFELRDQLTSGEPKSPINCTTGFNRGKVFVTADGTAATFISDADIIDTVIVSEDTATVSPSGYLLLRDGTRYRILNGTIDWMRDRNGNKLSFLYDSLKRVTSITDSLGRQITISYAPLNSPGSDVISYNGFGATARTISVNYDLLQNALRSDQVLQTPLQLFPETNGTNTTTYNPIVIKSVTLPNSQQYQLRYNSFGDVARAVLPTGGAIEYDYSAGLSDGAASGCFGGGASGKHVYRRVIERRTYPTGNSGAAYESKMTYSRPETTTATNLGYVVTEQCTSSGTTGVCGGAPALLAKEQHYFYGSARSSFYQDAVSYGGWQDGREYRTDGYDTNGTTVLSTAEHTFAQRAVVAWWTYDPLGAPPNDPRVTVTKTTIEPSGANLVSKRTAINPQDPNMVGFDQYNNQTDVWESDFGQSGAGAMLRHTHTHYLTTNSANGLAYDTLNPSAANPNLAATIHLRSLPVAIRVYAVNPVNGVETLAAQGTTSYDEPAYAAPPYESVTGWIDPGTARGNVTTSGRWLDTTGAYLLTHAQYDQCGNVRKTWDARDTGLTNPSQITYSDAFSDGVQRNTYAFPTSISTAVPDPEGVTGSNVALTTTSVYDFNSGKVVSTTDANSKTTSYDYTDPLNRLKLVTQPNGAHVNYSYSDAPNDLYVRVLADLDVSRVIETRQYFDNMGRAVREFLYDGTASTPWLATDTYYDNMGRVLQVSNPYRVSIPSNSVPQSCSACTTNAYDALGRVKSVTTPDNAQVTTSYSALTSGSSFSTTVLVTDQAGKQRRSLTDSLGRLVRVDEPDISGSLGSVSNPVQPSSYRYDVMGNLRLVTQGVQQRFFMYDSLGRLIRARNREQGNFTPANEFPALTDTTSGISNSDWSTGYIYDANGNLKSRIDARGVKSTYDYDALNRNTSVVYTDDPAGTPAVYRYYDGFRAGENKSIPHSNGRLWQTETTSVKASRTTINSFDALGRALSHSQEFYNGNSWSPLFTVQRSPYNLAGGVTSQTYPYGHTVTYAYDAAGRTNGFSGDLGDGIQRDYSTEIVYSPLGGMSKEKFGTNTPIFNKLLYNSRGQLAEIRASTSYTGPTDTTWNRGKFINWYSLQCGGAACNNNDNNGNLRKQETFVPNNDQNTSPTSWYQQYDYDSLNRLERVHEYTGNPSLDWQQSYSYDRWANRTINTTSGATFGWGINAIQTAIDPTTNRLYASNDPSHALINYDNAGNQTKDFYSGNGERQYDAENRMIAAQDNAGGWTYYTYDGDGERVRSWQSGVGTSGAQRWQVYGFDGELVAEYTATPAGRALMINLAGEYGYRNGQLLVKAAIGTTLTPDGGGGFESPNVGNGNYIVNPSGSGWGFSGSTGISGKQSALTIGNPNAPEGNQVAFIQGGSSSIISQSMQGFTPGATYAVTFSAAQRGNCCGAGGEDFRVFIVEDTGSVPVGTFKPGTTDYKDYSTIVFSPQKGPMLTLQFVGLNSAGGDNTALIDNVRIVIIDNVEWLATDQLGTPRMMFDKTGTLANVKRHDYLPFGEELKVNQGLRTTARGYGTLDGVRQKFTSKERDGETGLDYFGARYYASTQGRFSSPDPLLSSGIEEDPQSWNRYSYTLNNPLALIDPSGLYVFDSSVSEEQRKKFNAGLTQAKANLEKIAATYGPNSKEYNQAKRAVDVYGAEGVKNGVTIFASKGGEDGYTQVAGVAGARTKDNPTGQNIHITFNAESFKYEFLSEGIGHEGSHAADGSDWVKSSFAANKNPAEYQLEVNGYTVQSLMAEANNPNGSNSLRLSYFKEPGKNPYLPEQAPIWKSEWEGADRATLAAFRGSVDRILSRPKKAGGYGLTPASTKRAFTKGSSFPR